ncbi:MAG: PASTA domain-containing protein [Clostridia bacterium]|nr:PASTA domain-containing protein [Clostridia bacterium]
MAKLCMGCMNPLPEENDVCTVCGFDRTKDQNPSHCLPVTSALQGHYIVGRLMGEFPDHLLYLAYDRQMKEPCFIQEFFPAAIGRRDTINGVQPLEGRDKIFEEYADRFRANMRVLARMRELPAVVPVYDIFEENGTVYSVSDYCQGMTLTKKIKLSGGRIPWSEARGIFTSLIGSLTQLNDAGVCHLAICPDNILIGSDGKARLRNFSIEAAHRSGTNLAPELKAGYAAPEQYYTEEEVGAVTDVYGMAATVFRTVTGTEVPTGDKRAKNSDDLFMSAEVAEELGQNACVALFNALQVLPENRTSSLAVLRDELTVAPTVSALVDEAQKDIEMSDTDTNEEDAPVASDKKSLIVMLLISLGLLVAAIVVIVLLLLSGLGGNGQGNGGGQANVPTTTTTTTVATGDGNEAVVSDVVGFDYFASRNDKFNGMSLELLGFAHDPGQPEGAILHQYPAANELQAVGAPIQVIVNNPRAAVSVVIPKVAGWEQAKAEELLKALGFKVEVRAATDPKQDKGIVEDVFPLAGTSKEVGETITLLVSNQEKPELVDVPDLTNWTEEYAVKTLEMLGFTVQKEYNPNSTYEKGIVESVDGAGTQVAEGSVVILHISSTEPPQDNGGIGGWLGDLFG